MHVLDSPTLSTSDILNIIFSSKRQGVCHWYYANRINVLQYTWLIHFVLLIASIPCFTSIFPFPYENKFVYKSIPLAVHQSSRLSQILTPTVAYRTWQSIIGIINYPFAIPSSPINFSIIDKIKSNGFKLIIML